MQNRRGVLPVTTQLSFRVDTLTVESLKNLARQCDMDLSEYIRMILSRHTYHADVANEIKKEVKQIMEYSQSAFTEVHILKQRVEDLENQLRNHNINVGE